MNTNTAHDCRAQAYSEAKKTAAEWRELIEGYVRQRGRYGAIADEALQYFKTIYPQAQLTINTIAPRMTELENTYMRLVRNGERRNTRQGSGAHVVIHVDFQERTTGQAIQASLFDAAETGLSNEARYFPG